MLNQRAASWLLALAIPVMAQAQHNQPNSDPNCQFKSRQSVIVQRAPGQGVLNVGSANPIDCGAQGCFVSVLAMSYNRSDSGQAACCVQIATGTIKVNQGEMNIPITWHLAPDDGADKAEYFFAVNALTAFNSGNGQNPKKDELLPSTTDASGKNASVTSVNQHKGKKTFNYFLNVISKTASGQYLVCDPVDPVIINNGN